MAEFVCSKCGEAREDIYTCRQGGESVLAPSERTDGGGSELQRAMNAAVLLVRQDRGDAMADALERFFVASGGSGEAPAGLDLSDIELQTLVSYLDLAATYFPPVSYHVTKAHNKLRAASSGEVVATESGEGG